MNQPLPLEIDCSGVAGLMQDESNFVLLDCREPDEHATARIAGAVLLPMSELAARLHELKQYRGRRIAVCCHHGIRSLKVASFLRNQGFSGVQSMAGGIDAWSQQIDPSVPRY